MYEVFISHQMEPYETIVNISLIITDEYWNELSNKSNFPSNLNVHLTSSSYFMLNNISPTFDSFKRDNYSPKIFKAYEMICNLFESIPLGDYEMEVQVIWQDNMLTSSDVIVHVVDPVPTLLPVPGRELYM